MDFLYHPKSGDKALVARHLPGGPDWVQWENGSRHIFGGVRLDFPAAESGLWWRDSAATLAAEIANGVGGIAADECGMVRLWVPRTHAWRAWEMMGGVRPHGEPQWSRDGNLGRMVLAGVAAVGLIHGRLRVFRAATTEPRVSVLELATEDGGAKWRVRWEERAIDGEEWIVRRACGQSAPAEWPVAEVKAVAIVGFGEKLAVPPPWPLVEVAPRVGW